MPGVAAKIVSMAETEQKHRMGWETNALDSDIKLAKHGQLFGFCAAVLCIAGAILLGYWGMAWSAVVLGGMSAISLVRVFGNQPDRR